jgi:enoyl-[acyl-carrier-protein] reductase (NADH)
VESVSGANPFEKAATAAQLPILRAENIERGNLASYGDLPQEAAQAAFLLSDLASGVTAEITYVDGGFSQTAGLSADQV